jgi:hypothetical protein
MAAPVNSRTKMRGELSGLLAEGDRGTLTTALGEQLPVRVAGCDGDLVLLAPMLGHGEPLEHDSPARVLLEAASLHGIVRVRGEAAVRDGELVHFHVFGVIEVLQRRRFFRVRTPRRVEVSRGARVLDALSVDISGGGILMTIRDTLEPGDLVHFRLYLGTDDEPIEGSARVVRTAADGNRAIEFDEMPRQEEERLIRFLFDRQRAERAVTRGDGHRLGGAK